VGHRNRTAVEPCGNAVLRELARERGASSVWAVRLAADEAASALMRLNGASRLVMPLTAAPLSCVDLRALGFEAHCDEWALVVDATDCGVSGCACERLGAHASVTGLDDEACLVAVARDAEQALCGVVEWASALPALDEAELSTLVARSRRYWHAASDEAQVVTAYLGCHPRVAELRYPGSRKDPSFAVAARTLQGGFGPFVDLRLHGETSWRRLRCTGREPKEAVLSLERALSPVG